MNLYTLYDNADPANPLLIMIARVETVAEYLGFAHREFVTNVLDHAVIEDRTTSSFFIYPEGEKRGGEWKLTKGAMLPKPSPVEVYENIGSIPHFNPGPFNPDGSPKETRA